MTGGVGKSSLVLRFIKGTFRESYIPTIEDTYRQVREFYRMCPPFIWWTMIVDEETFSFAAKLSVECLLDTNIF